MLAVGTPSAPGNFVWVAVGNQIGCLGNPVGLESSVWVAAGSPALAVGTGLFVGSLGCNPERTGSRVSCCSRLVVVVGSFVDT